MSIRASVSCDPPLAIFPRGLERGEQSEEAQRQQADAHDEQHLQPGRHAGRISTLIQLLFRRFTAQLCLPRRHDAGLSELAEQIEHLWGISSLTVCS